MRYHCARIMIAATASGSGKTTITCGLLKLLQDHRILSRAFKCGPDYIDPLFHREVLGISGVNLDSYFLQPHQVCKQLLANSLENGISVLEGVMGFYDGIGGNSTKSSCYEVAVITKTPVILVVDGKGSSLSIIALIQGFLTFREDHQIRGIILNRVKGMMAERLRPLIEELGLELIGYLPPCEEAVFDSRHLGLIVPTEVAHIQSQITGLANRLAKTIDLERLCEIAKQAEDLEGQWDFLPAQRAKTNQIRIGIAQDQAFCFYYQENLRLLEQAGAEFVSFSPLSDQELPADLSGLLLGGGYPEIFAKRLSQNDHMLRSIHQAVAGGIPTLAECGGFLYLHNRLEGTDGTVYPMVGIIDGDGYKTEKLSRFGYLSLSAVGKSQWLAEQEAIKGHEFHYWESTVPGNAWIAQKPGSDRKWHCIQATETLLAGFPHLYYPSNPGFVDCFISRCRKYKESSRVID